MKPILKAAIFDLDGTLLDSMNVWKQVDFDFLARRGIALPDDYTRVIAPMGFPAAAHYTKERFALPEDEESIMREWHGMAVEAYACHIEAKPHAGDYLASLAARGIPMAVATASLPAFYEPCLRRLGFYGYFSLICDNRSVTRGKGFPDIYLLAAERFGVAPASCAVFEDIGAGIRGAVDGGFFTVGVYDAYCSDGDYVREHCDRYITDFSALIEEDIF